MTPVTHSNALIVISAPSGAGKTTLCQRLLTEFADQLVLSISSTTRAPRKNEQEGVHYHFLTKARFEADIARQAFAEWATVHDHYYGTARQTLESAWSAGKSVLLDIDVQGARALRSTYPTQTLLIFIEPPSMEALEERLRSRGTDSDETIQKRLKNARQEIAARGEFDVSILNDDLERAYSQLKQSIARFLNG